MRVETFPGLPVLVVVAMENLDRASAVCDAVNQAAIHLPDVFSVVDDDNVRLAFFYYAYISKKLLENHACKYAISIQLFSDTISSTILRSVYRNNA